jgi:hypothetical protein
MAFTIENALNLVTKALQLAEDVGDAAIAKRNDLGGLSAMFLARAGQSLFSSGLLAQNGLNADAMSCGRTVVEMAIDYAYIATDPTTLIKKFTDYDHVAKFKIAKATDELHGGMVPRDAMRILQQRHDTARLNNPESEHNWAGVSIKKRAIEVDRLKTYELPYADMCNASHSCYGTLEYALAGLNDDPQIHFGRMEPDSKPPDLAFASMMMMIIDVIRECQLVQSLDARARSLLDERRAFIDGMST